MKNLIKSYWVQILVILTVIYVIFAPLIFTAQGPRWANLLGKGEIGDTIGGITAPAIGLLSSILVFISFREQVKANNLLVEMRREDFLVQNISEWTKRIEENSNDIINASLYGMENPITMYLEALGVAFEGLEESKITKAHYTFTEEHFTLFEFIHDATSLLDYIKHSDLKPYQYQINLRVLSKIILNTTAGLTRRVSLYQNSIYKDIEVLKPVKELFDKHINMLELLNLLLNHSNPRNASPRP